jgi:squalene synthase HpnC
MAAIPRPLVGAYARCSALARSHYENFPVASWLLPPAMRPHVAAIYAFARIADDIADEGAAPARERHEHLRTWQQRLHAAVGAADASRAMDDRDSLIVTALAHTIRSFELPTTLFDDLVSAFEQDTRAKRYASWNDVLDYCRRSANPIGRLVLRIAGYRDEALDRSSDALCTALQLTNFWQDFGRDWRAGRLYVPRDVQEACGAREGDLAGTWLTAEWIRAIEACARFTRAQFLYGRAVCDGVWGRLRLELRLTWLGGVRVLDRVERRGRDLLHHRPTIGPADMPLLLWRAVTWKGAAA